MTRNRVVGPFYTTPGEVADEEADKSRVEGSTDGADAARHKLHTGCLEAQPGGGAPDVAILIGADAGRPDAVSSIPTAEQTITAEEFHGRNRMDWVGIAHNRGLDQMRAELRAPGRMEVSSICARAIEHGIAEFVADGPNQAARSRHARDVAARGIARSPLCRTLSRTGHAAIPGTVRYLNASNGGATLGRFATLTSVEEYLDNIVAAVDNSTNANDLAGSLASITADLSGLDTAGVDAVLGAASLALSSAEYWSANAPSFAAEVEAEFPCVIQHNCVVESIVALPTFDWSWSEFKAGLWTATKVIGGADLVCGVQVIGETWLAGPIGWEAAGASAITCSVIAAVGLAIYQ